jgi:hypothetical protein
VLLIFSQKSKKNIPASLLPQGIRDLLLNYAVKVTGDIVIVDPYAAGVKNGARVKPAAR